MTKKKLIVTKNRIERETLGDIAVRDRSMITVPFSRLTRPGAYYCHSTGWLYRIPEDMLSEDHSPLMNIVSREDHLVTMISEDPWVPVGKARRICTNQDFVINF